MDSTNSCQIVALAAAALRLAGAVAISATARENNALGRHSAKATTRSVFNNCACSIDFNLGGKG